MGTVKVPEGTTGGYVVTLPAPGRKPRKHVTTGKLSDAIEWLMRLRRLQADGLSFEDALTQANEESEARAHPVPGRRQEGAPWKRSSRSS